MVIDENYNYTIKEASAITNVGLRTLTRYAVKLNKERVNNRYLLRGSELIQYCKDENVNKIDYTSLLRLNENANRQLDTLKTNVKTLSQDVQVLSAENVLLKIENTKLKTQKDIEIEALKEDNKRLKTNELKDIPHQEKLKRAIETITLEAMRENVTHKIFTDTEYNDLVGTLSEVEFQKEQVNYLRTRVEKQDSILTELVQQTTQRNFLRAKDKGYDKE